MKMKMHLFWDMIKEIVEKTELNIDQVTVWQAGDLFVVQQPSSSIEHVSTEELIYATDKEDPNIGSVLFVRSSKDPSSKDPFSRASRIDGSVSVVTADRYLETIETMRKLVDGELFLEEVLTSSVEWKRELFKHIYSKYKNHS
jgi:hypothetical protein